MHRWLMVLELMSMDFETFKQNVRLDWHAGGIVVPDDDRVMARASITFTMMKPVPTGDYFQMTLLKDDVLEDQIKDWLSRDLWELLREEFGQVDGKGGFHHGPTGRSC